MFLQVFVVWRTLREGGVPATIFAVPCCRYAPTYPGQRGIAKPCQTAAVVVEVTPAAEVSSPFDDRQSLRQLDRDGCAAIEIAS